MSSRDRKRRVRSLLARDGSDCWLCHQPLDDDITIDHIIPRCRNGVHALTNLKLAHKSCNERRGSMEAMETEPETILVALTSAQLDALLEHFDLMEVPYSELGAAIQVLINASEDA